jgi:hypothetical protein
LVIRGVILRMITPFFFQHILTYMSIFDTQANHGGVDIRRGFCETAQTKDGQSHCNCTNRCNWNPNMYCYNIDYNAPQIEERFLFLIVQRKRNEPTSLLLQWRG